ncbi:MAG: YHS domain-containing protein [Spirochaetales bacterium]|nr:YHS domain-containing protein [Spirochaetales bacterium]
MKTLLLSLLLVLPVSAIYASGEYDSIVYVKDTNIALEGYDTVAYFENNKPVKGSTQWKTTYNGVEWLFSAENNLKLFQENPDIYAPEYGGYCAWAMNEGDLAPGKPKYWDIINGKLYLNYSSSTRKKFLADLDSMISNADSKWPEKEDQLAKTVIE